MDSSSSSSTSSTQDPLVPLPLVRAASGRSWNQIYSAADRGLLGPVTRLGSRLYAQHDAALAYLERVRPAEGIATLARLLGNATVGRAP